MGSVAWWSRLARDCGLQSPPMTHLSSVSWMQDKNRVRVILFCLQVLPVNMQIYSLVIVTLRVHQVTTHHHPRSHRLSRARHADMLSPACGGACCCCCCQYPTLALLLFVFVSTWLLASKTVLAVSSHSLRIRVTKLGIYAVSFAYLLLCR